MRARADCDANPSPESAENTESGLHAALPILALKLPANLNSASLFAHPFRIPKNVPAFVNPA